MLREWSWQCLDAQFVTQPMADSVAKHLEIIFSIPRTRKCPWDLRLVPGDNMVLMINPITFLVRLVLNLKVLEIISIFFATLSATGCIKIKEFAVFR